MIDLRQAWPRPAAPRPIVFVGAALLALRGSWFTEAFEGPMSNLQRFVSGEDEALVSPVSDAITTMARVEACYTSTAGGSTPVPAA